MYLLTETVSPFALERWAAFFANFGQFAKGFLYTLGISIGALIVALLLGLIFGAMSSTHNKVLRGISRVYVEIFQNTPLLVINQSCQVTKVIKPRSLMKVSKHKSTVLLQASLTKS